MTFFKTSIKLNNGATLCRWLSVLCWNLSCFCQCWMDLNFELVRGLNHVRRSELVLLHLKWHSIFLFTFHTLLRRTLPMCWLGKQQFNWKDNLPAALDLLQCEVCVLISTYFSIFGASFFLIIQTSREEMNAPCVPLCRPEQPPWSLLNVSIRGHYRRRLSFSVLFPNWSSWAASTERTALTLQEVLTKCWDDVVNLMLQSILMCRRQG